MNDKNMPNKQWGKLKLDSNDITTYQFRSYSIKYEKKKGKVIDKYGNNITEEILKFVQVKILKIIIEAPTLNKWIFN